MKEDTIKILGARVHNLKNVDLEIPRRKLVVITGLSGSGKSSLAFDTIYAEGLINQFAVTSVTLERLANEINNGDLIEDFVQGAQKLRRESPALRAYNTTIKSFSALTNQLVALLPEKEKKSAGDELMSFITKPAARSGK